VEETIRICRVKPGVNSGWSSQSRTTPLCLRIVSILSVLRFMVPLVIFSMTGLISAEATEKQSLVITDTVMNRTWKFTPRIVAGVNHIRLIDLQEFLGAKLEHSLLGQRYTLISGGHRVEFKVSRTEFFVDQLVLKFREPVNSTAGEILIPLDFFTLALPFLRDVSVTFDSTAMTMNVTERKGKPATVEKVDPGTGPISPVATRAPGTTPLKLRSVTIDPGHGGKDCGAIGPGGLQEKEVVLQIAKLLRDRLKRKYGIDVFLTREDDTFLELDQRAAIANNNKSDIFLSIHTNSGKRKLVQGFEVFYLNRQPSDDYAMETATQENVGSSTGQGANQTQKVSEDIQAILWDLIQNKYMEESSILAEKILLANEASFNRSSRGVKQAPFVVLFGIEMPAVLVEVDFISNPSQEKQLKDEDYLQRISDSLIKGIIDFKKHYEKILGTTETTSGN
jgi:N-acetylmuramoyl-L-alanine amidase